MCAVAIRAEDASICVPNPIESSVGTVRGREEVVKERVVSHAHVVDKVCELLLGARSMPKRCAQWHRQQYKADSFGGHWVAAMRYSEIGGASLWCSEPRPVRATKHRSRYLIL
jgi:hypothetical protein